jgi:hypothetical protein
VNYDGTEYTSSCHDKYRVRCEKPRLCAVIAWEVRHVPILVDKLRSDRGVCRNENCEKAITAVRLYSRSQDQSTSQHHAVDIVEVCTRISNTVSNTRSYELFDILSTSRRYSVENSSPGLHCPRMYCCERKQRSMQMTSDSQKAAIRSL